MSQMSDKNRTVLVIGTTGSGKSTFANFLFKEKKFKVKRGGFSSVTTATEGHPLKLSDRELFIIDTPGFSDTARPDEEIIDELGEAVTLAKDGAHALFICVRAGTRFGRGEQSALEQMEKLGNFWEHAVVIFTQAGEFGDTDEIQDRALTADLQSKNTPKELKWLMAKVRDRRVIVEARDDMGRGYYDKKLKHIVDAVERAFGNARRVRYTNRLFTQAQKKFKEEKEKQKLQMDAVQTQVDRLKLELEAERKALEATKAKMKEEISKNSSSCTIL